MDRAERVARLFHDTAQRLAPSFGYDTHPESAVPWHEAPENNRLLLIAVAREVLEALTYGLPADIECGAIKPGTEDDVLPVRCRVPSLQHPTPDRTHWHPPLWPGTPDLLWEL